MLLPRRSSLKHPSGILIDLPCLIPSFSSKGFPFFRKIEENVIRNYSETTYSLELLGPFIKDYILISAYDLHLQYYREPERYFNNKLLVFIDSGGYELSSDWDSTEAVRYTYKPEKFTEDDYLRVLKKLPTGINYVIANYDWATRGQSMESQIASAQKLFNKFPKHCLNFVAKPSTKKSEYLNVQEFISCLPKCKNFHIVGFTEKELGKDLLDRMEKIAKIRTAMDQEGMVAPIHIWGGLDPIITPLYFFAGAQIFDGISWLRYAYHSGMAVYRDAYSILNPDFGGLESSMDQSHAVSLTRNIAFLQNLTTSLKRFVDKLGNDFSMFNEQEAAFKKAYEVFTAKAKVLSGR